MSSVTDYREEVESLHAFFVDWYTGVADSEDFQALEDALAPSFEMIPPTGAIADRETVTSAVREAFDTYEQGSFDIEIRDVEVVEQYDQTALVRYEEWQDDAGEESGRLSTALFTIEETTNESPTVEWRYLQETWLEQG